MTDLPCKDCKFCKPDWFFLPIFKNYEFAKCHRPGNYESDIVSGHLVYKRGFCDIDRKYDHLCGIEGKHFVPKRSKEIKYYDIIEKQKKTRELMEKMYSDLKKAGAIVYEGIDAYTVPGKPGHFCLKTLKEKYLSGEVSEIEGQWSHHYPICVRRVRADAAMISMSAGDGEDWYSISLISYERSRPEFLRFAGFVGAALIRLYGARPHWGKWFPEGEFRADLYSELPEFLSWVRRADPEGVFHRGFTGRVLGLSE